MGARQGHRLLAGIVALAMYLSGMFAAGEAAAQAPVAQDRGIPEAVPTVSMPDVDASLLAVPPLSSAVVDTSGTLSGDAVGRIQSRIAAFETRTGSQLQVLVVPTTGGESIEAYAIRAFDTWKLGRRDVDDGLLLVVAKNDRRARIEVGYGLEGAIPDITAGRVLDEYVVPRFRAGDYAGGIEAGVEQLVRLAEGEALPPPGHDSEEDVIGRVVLLLILLALVGGAVASLRWLRWPWVLGATVLAWGLVAAMAPGQFAAYLLLMPFVLVFCWPLGWGLMQSGKLRWCAAAVLALIVLVAVLAHMFGGIKVMAGIGIVLGAAFLSVFLSLPVLGATHTWKHNRSGFWVRACIWIAGLSFALYKAAAADWSIDVMIPAGFACFIGTIVLFATALPGGSGSGSRSSRSGSGSSRSRSSRSSSSSSRSGGGGSSGGGGASRSW